MDEEGAGTEMLVRKTDGAILTRAKKGDAIIPADLTDNLFSWGRVAPEELLTKLERQQQALHRLQEFCPGWLRELQEWCSPDARKGIS